MQPQLCPGSSCPAMPVEHGESSPAPLVPLSWAPPCQLPPLQPGHTQGTSLLRSDLGAQRFALALDTAPGALRPLWHTPAGPWQHRAQAPLPGTALCLCSAHPEQVQGWESGFLTILSWQGQRNLLPCGANPSCFLGENQKKLPLRLGKARRKMRFLIPCEPCSLPPVLPICVSWLPRGGFCPSTGPVPPALPRLLLHLGVTVACSCSLQQSLAQ